MWKELRSFRDGEAPYGEQRDRWFAEYDRNEREALDALAQSISARINVCSAVVRALIVQLVLRF